MFVRGFRAVGGGYPFPGEEFRVGSSPGRSLNMRGMFNPELGPVGKASGGGADTAPWFSWVVAGG